MAGRHATLYDFRDLDLMFRIAEANGELVAAADLADWLGFESGDNRPIGIRLAWMKRYGMVAYNESEKGWKLSPGGVQVVASRLNARQSGQIDQLPEGALVDVMAHLTTRANLRGDPMLGALLRREFLYGTQRR